MHTGPFDRQASSYRINPKRALDLFSRSSSDKVGTSNGSSNTSSYCQLILMDFNPHPQGDDNVAQPFFLLAKVHISY